MAPAATDGPPGPARSPAAHAGASTGLGVALSLTVLLLTAPRPQAAVADLAGAASSSDPLPPLVAAVSLLAWTLSGWLALTVALVLLSRLPGLLGRVARTVAGRVAPATVRRAVEAALGLTVAVGALAPTGALAVPVAAPAASAGAEARWELDWPSRTATLPPVTSAPVPASPRTAASRPPATAPPARPPTPAPPVAAAPPDRPAVVRPTTAPASAAVVVVRPGDSLWSLAEQALRRSGTEPTDRQVAQAWPRWWAANRAVVGDDPDLLLPGTVLRPPPGAGAT